MSRRRPAPCPCPCGLGPEYADCCGRWSAASAPTPELLMRSRYTAFAQCDAEHLLRTWHPSTRPARLDLDPGLRWTGLEVLATSGGGLLETRGTVAFEARAVQDGQPHVRWEHSLFLREAGDWLYVNALAP